MATSRTAGRCEPWCSDWDRNRRVKATEGSSVNEDSETVRAEVIVIQWVITFPSVCRCGYRVNEVALAAVSSVVFVVSVPRLGEQRPAVHRPAVRLRPALGPRPPVSAARRRPLKGAVAGSGRVVVVSSNRSSTSSRGGASSLAMVPVAVSVVAWPANPALTGALSVRVSVSFVSYVSSSSSGTKRVRSTSPAGT